LPHTLIAGAGPAGLTAAYELRQLGLGSTIVEADNQVGGLSQTVNYKGFRFDIGGHRFFSKVPLINDLWHPRPGRLPDTSETIADPLSRTVLRLSIEGCQCIGRTWSGRVDPHRHELYQG